MVPDVVLVAIVCMNHKYFQLQRGSQRLNKGSHQQPDSSALRLMSSVRRLWRPQTAEVHAWESCTSTNL